MIANSITTINPRSQCLGQEWKNILRHFFFLRQNDLKLCKPNFERILI